MDFQQPTPRRFSDCDLTERLFYTAFLSLMGLGYLMALTFLYTTHENIDGRPGLSVTDIAYDYYGNRSGTRLEAAIRGAMSGYLDDDARETLVAWLKSGAPQKGYEARVAPILNQRCVMCHSKASGMAIPDLTSFAGVKQVADVDTGHSLESLVRVSHIHLFGVGLVLMSIGLVFRMAALPDWLKATLFLTPFVAILVDILAWFLTKWDSHFAITIFIAGTFLGLAIGGQILISLYQMWVPLLRGKHIGT